MRRVHITPWLGADIRKFSEMALAISERCGLVIEFEFNDVHLYVRPWYTTDLIVNAYDQTINPNYEPIGRAKEALSATGSEPRTPEEISTAWAASMTSVLPE